MIRRAIPSTLVRAAAMAWLLTSSVSLGRAARLRAPLEQGWHFVRRDVAADASTADWTIVSVPHTWNATDGQDGPTPRNTARAYERGSDYYRGVGWYARSFEVPPDWQGRRLFLQFEAASQIAVVYVNGQPVGTHAGGFTAFCFEITKAVHAGANEVRVRVDNTLVRSLPPLAGDFNVDGGLYRPVHLLVTDPVCITPLYYGSPGVFITTRDLHDDRAAVDVRAMVSNGAVAVAPVRVRTTIRDAHGEIVATVESQEAIEAGAENRTIQQALTIPRPHRWQGRRDPYLYTVSVELRANDQPIDLVEQRLGLRTVEMAADGFRLNGAKYPVYGVCRHQDKRDKGWALSPADEEEDLGFIERMGATAIRLAHYPQSDHLHDLCDRAGILVWNEVPFVNEVPHPDESVDAPSADTLAFNAVLELELREMILQRYNHPAAAWWGLFNELRPGAMCRAALPEVTLLNRLAHELDATRPTVGATDHVANPTNLVPDTTAYNVYPGWYSGVGAMGELAALIDAESAEHQGAKVALSEYGAGGNPDQHEEGALKMPDANAGTFHPEEWQALMHERDWAQIKDNPKVWGSFLWVMFDFASDGRKEGGSAGINDKGLVTQDRGVTKDAYHFYRANWTTEPMVYLCSRRATPRHTDHTTVKVYANVPSVELWINGRSQGVRTPNAIHVAQWDDVPLTPGTNHVEAKGIGSSSSEVGDTCEWVAAPGAARP